MELDPNAMKVVQAGMKVLYAPETREMLQRAVKSESSTPEALAMNVVGVIKILFDKSKRTIPPQAIPTALMVLTFELASFMRDAGRDVPVEDVKKAILIGMGLLKQVFSKIPLPKKGAPAQGQRPPQGRQPPQGQRPPPAPPQQPPAPQGGLIQQPQMMGA